MRREERKRRQRGEKGNGERETNSYHDSNKKASGDGESISSPIGIWKENKKTRDRFVSEHAVFMKISRVAPQSLTAIHALNGSAQISR